MLLTVTILYLITAGLCFRAARLGERAWKAAWLTIGCFFVTVAVWRVAGAEEAVRAAMRAEIVERGEYEFRQAVQRPLAAVALLALAGWGVWGALRLSKLGPRRLERAVFWAKAAALTMAGLIAVRLISLHATDLLLYSGPHLNRAIDPALTLFTGVQAALFAREAGRAERG